MIGVERFQEYLRIKTVQPNPDYEQCAQFLQKYAQELDLEFKRVEYVKGKPVVILGWIGLQPELKSIILNSHTDVVPVSVDKWTVDPFAAVKRPNGDIVARGSQDMKCVGIWYLEAIRALKQQGKRLKKTLWLTFVPDEEIGGSDGMKKFIVSPEFQQLNAGFALDEGLANETNAFKVYYGERAPWWIKLKAKGGAGHGSKFIEPNATVRLLKVLDRFSSFRQHELNRLEYGKHDDGRPLLLGDVTTVNITILQAGQQTNVVPEEAIAHVDCRVAPTVDHDKFEKLLRSWCAPEQVELEFLQVFRGNGMTHIQTLKEYELLSEVAKKHQIPLEPEIFPAATDSRFLRQIGLNCLGISAIRNHPVLLHDHDEYLNEKTFIEGIDFYRDFLSAIGNLEY